MRNNNIYNMYMQNQLFILTFTGFVIKKSFNMPSRYYGLQTVIIYYIYYLFIVYYRPATMPLQCTLHLKVNM